MRVIWYCLRIIFRYVKRNFDVTESSPSMPPVSKRVRRLIYQASYTGMKETDLLLGLCKIHYLI